MILWLSHGRSDEPKTEICEFQSLLFRLSRFFVYSFSFLGRCIDGINTYRCICDPGYVGRKCDTDYDDCSSSPCAHG